MFTRLHFTERKRGARVTLGLTFIEMMVTLSIFAIVMIALVNSILFFYRANTSSIQQAYQVESARRGVQLLVRDIREATYGADGSYPLAEMASTSITFNADTDRDAAVEKIRYTLSGTSLSRTVIEPTGNPAQYVGSGETSVVSDHARNLGQNIAVFQYFNASTTEVVNPNAIASVVSVTVSIIVNISPYRLPGEFTLRSSATLRNLRAQ